MRPPIICLVTSGRMTGTTESLEWIAEAAGAGADLIQVREPALNDRALLSLVRSAIAAAAGTSTRIVVNDRLDVALAADAHGVHLRSSSLRASGARRLAPGGFLIGRSVHSADEADQAEREGGCDYLIFGTVFASGSKPEGHHVSGLAELQAVCARVALPVLAIGGITPATAREAARAGAAGVAGIGVFATARSLSAVVRELRHAFDSPSEAV